MARLRFLIACFAILIHPPGAEEQAASEAQDAPKAGVLVAKIVTLADPQQSYALYLPSNYSRKRPWPIIYAFDPVARGKIPAELLKDAAERYGYIVVGSNNSRNGSWKLEYAAADAMLRDTRTRFSVDDRRMYFAGFSGGARVSAQIAENCNCAAGVLLNGAGFSPKPPAAPGKIFSVFAGAGIFDFNYPEVARMGDRLEELAIPYFFRSYAGPHQWAPGDFMNEALAWFRLQAMKTGREPRNDEFIQQQFQQALERTQKSEQSGDLYAAWNEYRQAARAFEGLGEVGVFRLRAQTLEKEKSVRDAAKRQRQEFDEQARLESPISSGLWSLVGSGGQLTENHSTLELQILTLRNRAEHEKQAQTLRPLKRALAGLFVQSMEAGSDQLAGKQIEVARAYFELAVTADPASLWALENVAITRALTGDRKGALETLRRAQSRVTDDAAFADWLKTEPAFAKLRADPDFRVLLDSTALR